MGGEGVDDAGPIAGGETGADGGGELGRGEPFDLADPQAGAEVLLDFGHDHAEGAGASVHASAVLASLLHEPAVGYTG